MHRTHGHDMHEEGEAASKSSSSKGAKSRCLTQVGRPTRVAKPTARDSKHAARDLKDEDVGKLDESAIRLLGEASAAPRGQDKEEEKGTKRKG